MNYTQHYQLPTWAEDDRILRTDFNDMTEKLENGLAELAGQVSSVGNCSIYTTSYTGTGGSGASTPNRLTFPGQPVAVFVADTEEGRSMLVAWGMEQGYVYRYEGVDQALTWSGNSLTWYQLGGTTAAQDQLNKSGRLYRAFALVEA